VQNGPNMKPILDPTKLSGPILSRYAIKLLS
jgi:hypothetical protein